MATAGGVLLAHSALSVFLPFAGQSVPRLSQASIDGRVLAFSMLVAALTSVLFSLAPAFQAAGSDSAGALKEGAQSIASGHDRFRSGLVVVQITLGLILIKIPGHYWQIPLWTAGVFTVVSGGIYVNQGVKKLGG